MRLIVQRTFERMILDIIEGQAMGELRDLDSRITSYAFLEMHAMRT